MDYSEGTVIVIDTPSWSSLYYSEFRGDAWSSDYTGSRFVRSLGRVVLQKDPYDQDFDFHKIESLDGTYIATIVDGQGNLRTKISWNRGGTWQDVISQAGLDGLVLFLSHSLLPCFSFLIITLFLIRLMKARHLSFCTEISTHSPLVRTLDSTLNKVPPGLFLL